jgi:diadenosine tetraphosphate (Ap4A) HIT family hydrolase
MIEEKCLFCNYNLLKDDILWESDNFFVKVGVGIFAPGHVMIVTKKHISCFGELPKELSKEFLLLKEDIFQKVKLHFSEPVVCENGICGQSVNHAHIHFIPNKSKLYHLEHIKEKIFPDLKSTKIEDIFQIIPVFEKESSYFYLEENGQKWIFHTKSLPKKEYTFRKEFTRLTGLYGLSNWRHMPKEEKIRNKKWVRVTKEKLKSI